MTLPPEDVVTWTSPADVISRWLPVGTEPEGTEELARVQALIEDIEDFLISKFPSIENRVLEGTLRVSKIKRIVSNAVIRAWKMAKDPRISFSESEGPSSISGSYSSQTQVSQYLTDAELAELAPSAGQGFTQDLARNSSWNAYGGSTTSRWRTSEGYNELGWKIKASEWSD